jgi:hypothetical protein
MSYGLPPIVKLAERLLVDIEQAVLRFARRHRYASGADLRAQAMEVARLTHRAWRDRPKQRRWVTRLVQAVDDLKLTMQLAKEVHAFASFGQFQALARTAADLGRQVGGWFKQLHPTSQNAPAAAPPQRAQRLGTQNASKWANA